mgnify:CR=1 FL=1
MLVTAIQWILAFFVGYAFVAVTIYIAVCIVEALQKLKNKRR